MSIKKMNNIATDLTDIATSLDVSGFSGAIINPIKSILSIKDKIYLSKFQKFWSAPEEQKIEIRDFIEKTKEQEDWQKVGENFLLVIDGFSAFDKCYYYGKAWIAWLNKEISTNEFIEITDILQNIFVADLQYILYHFNDKNFSYPNEDRLYNCGLLERRNMHTSFPPNRGSMMSDVNKDFARLKDWVEGVINHMNQPYVVTKIGKKLIEILTKK